MQTGTSPRSTHIVLAAFPAFGHVRPVLALASSLIPLGYTVTLITGTSFRARVEAIQGVEFVPLRGKADFDFDVPFAERFPGRPSGGSATLPFDMEHVFHDGFDEQFEVVKEVIERPDLRDRPTVIIAAAAFVGTMPMSLRSPSIRHVPLIGLGHFPLGVLSKDTAPMGMGLPSQGIEKNLQLNQDAIAMFSSVAACERRLLEPYHCTKALPSPYHFDNWVLLCDVYFQLSVPALELPRSDLPANVRFCGALEGHNAAGTTTTTTGLLPPWFNEFVLPSSSSIEASHPLILVTSGTLPGQSAHDLILPTIAACASLPVRLVVCAVHVPFDPALHLPPNVRWAQWIPFEAILPHTALVVSSGGYGSITQAFAHGVPIICAGVTEEKPHTSMLAAASGAGINLKTQTPDVERIRSAVLEMLGNLGFHAKAEELGKAYKEADPVGRIVEAVEEMSERFFSDSSSM